MVTDNPVIKEPSYFNLLKCGRNFLNRLDATYERPCMATPREKYHTEIYKTLTDYNECNNEPLSNENIREAIHKFMEEESISDANNVTEDTFIHTSNTKIYNANEIFTSEKIDKSDDLTDALNDLTIKNDGYYASNSAIASNAQGDIKRDPKTVTHTSNIK